MPTKLLSDWLASIESELDLEPDVLAAAIGVPLRTLYRWRRGESYPQIGARKSLDALYDLEQDIHRSIGRGKVVATWMRTPTAYLGGMRPVDAFKAGRFDTLRGLIAALEHGTFS